MSVDLSSQARPITPDGGVGGACPPKAQWSTTTPAPFGLDRDSKTVCSTMNTRVVLCHIILIKVHYVTCTFISDVTNKKFMSGMYIRPKGLKYNLNITSIGIATITTTSITEREDNSVWNLVGEVWGDQIFLQRGCLKREPFPFIWGGLGLFLAAKFRFHWRIVVAVLEGGSWFVIPGETHHPRRGWGGLPPQCSIINNHPRPLRFGLWL